MINFLALLLAVAPAQSYIYMGPERPKVILEHVYWDCKSSTTDLTTYNFTSAGGLALAPVSAVTAAPIDDEAFPGAIHILVMAEDSAVDWAVSNLTVDGVSAGVGRNETLNGLVDTAQAALTVTQAGLASVDVVVTFNEPVTAAVVCLVIPLDTERNSNAQPNSSLHTSSAVITHTTTGLIQAGSVFFAFCDSEDSTQTVTYGGSVTEVLDANNGEFAYSFALSVVDNASPIGTTVASCDYTGTGDAELGSGIIR